MSKIEYQSYIIKHIPAYQSQPGSTLEVLGAYTCTCISVLCMSRDEVTSPTTSQAPAQPITSQAQIQPQLHARAAGTTPGTAATSPHPPIGPSQGSLINGSTPQDHQLSRLPDHHGVNSTDIELIRKRPRAHSRRRSRSPKLAELVVQARRQEPGQEAAR